MGLSLETGVLSLTHTHTTHARSALGCNTHGPCYITLGSTIVQLVYIQIGTSRVGHLYLQCNQGPST